MMKGKNTRRYRLTLSYLTVSSVVNYSSDMTNFPHQYTYKKHVVVH